MTAQPGKGETQKHLKFGDDDRHDDSDDDDSSSGDDSPSESEDTTPVDKRNPPVEGAPSKKAASGKGKKKLKKKSAGDVVKGRKGKRKAVANVAALNFGPSLSAKKAKAAAADPVHDKAVGKAPAQQATSIPKIDIKTVQPLNKLDRNRPSSVPVGVTQQRSFDFIQVSCGRALFT